MAFDDTGTPGYNEGMRLATFDVEKQERSLTYIILCDARPEYPQHDHGEKCEERFEKSTVNFMICPLANMGAYYVLKNLTDSEK